MIPSFVRVAATTKLSFVFAVCLLVSVLFSALAAQVQVRLPEMTVEAGTVITIPVTIGDLGNEKVTAFEFVVSCDTTVIRLSGVEQGGTRSDGLTMFANNRVRPFGPGRMKVVCASAEPILGRGVLVKIIAAASNRAGSTDVILSNVVLNAGKPEVRGVNGSIRLKLKDFRPSKRRSDSSDNVR
jgi:hypothetical protein